jgi:dihydroflavonol-4-reductase
VSGDVTDAASITRALAGCDAVIHSAACVTRLARRPHEHERVNVDGTRTVIAAARERGVRCVVTSSFLALGPSRPGEIPGEDGPFAPPPRPETAYAETKRRALALTREAMAEGADVIALAPGALYGPGPARESNYIRTMVQRFLDGRLFALPAGGRTRLTWSWIHDVATAHVRALTRGGAGLFVLGGPAASVRDALAVVARRTGRCVPAASLPLGALEVAGDAFTAIARLTGSAPAWTRAEIAAYRADWTYDSTRAVHALDYRMTPLDAGLGALVDEMRGRGGGV